MAEHPPTPSSESSSHSARRPLWPSESVIGLRPRSMRMGTSGRAARERGKDILSNGASAGFDNSYDGVTGSKLCVALSGATVTVTVECSREICRRKLGPHYLKSFLKSNYCMFFCPKGTICFCKKRVAIITTTVRESVGVILSKVKGCLVQVAMA